MRRKSVEEDARIPNAFGIADDETDLQAFETARNAVSEARKYSPGARGINQNRLLNQFIFCRPTLWYVGTVIRDRLYPKRLEDDINVLVIGGTGTVGSGVVKRLLDVQNGTDTIWIMTRSTDTVEALPKGAEGVIGDLKEKASLPRAFRGVDRVFFLTTPESGAEEETGLNAVAAAVDAGVDVRDIAAAAVRALFTDDFNGKTYSLVGPDLITGNEVARLYSKHLDATVRYTGDDLDQWRAQQKLFLPDWLVDDLSIMYAHFLKHGLKATADDHAQTQEILGCAPRSYEPFVREGAAQWTQQRELQPSCRDPFDDLGTGREGFSQLGGESVGLAP